MSLHFDCSFHLKTRVLYYFLAYKPSLKQQWINIGFFFLFNDPPVAQDKKFEYVKTFGIRSIKCFLTIMQLTLQFFSAPLCMPSFLFDWLSILSILFLYDVAIAATLPELHTFMITSRSFKI